MSPHDARMLTRYNAWANKLIFDAVAALPGDEATKERKTLFKNMVYTLNHNYVIDLIWQAHLEGREHGFTARNTKDEPPLAELWAKQQEIDRWYEGFFEKLPETALNEEINFVLVGGSRQDDARPDPAARGQPHDLPPRLRRGSLLPDAG